MALCRCFERLFIMWLSGTQYDQLAAAVKQIVQYMQQQIKSLLVDQTGHHGDQWRSGRHMQAEFRLDSRFAVRFSSLPVINRIAVGNNRVRLRVILRDINTIKNTGQLISIPLQQFVQSFSVEIQLDFFCITG